MEWNRRSKLDWAAFVLDPEYGLGDSQSSDARICVAGWANFAKKFSLQFKDELTPEDLAEGGETTLVLRSLAGHGFPINHVRGWTQGVWSGCQFYGYHALDARENRSIQQFRFALAKVAPGLPEVVYDWRLDAPGAAGEHMWQPRFADYQAVQDPAARPSAEPKRPGLLGRTKVGQLVSSTLDKVDSFKGKPKQVHTDDPAFAEALLRQSAGEGPNPLFQCTWAVKGDWAVTWYPDGTPGESHSRRSKFMDFLPQLVRHLQSTPRS